MDNNLLDGISPLMDYYDHYGYAPLLNKLSYEYTKRELEVLAKKLGVGCSPAVVASEISEFARKRGHSQDN